jgi:hypothetical protein
MAKITWLGEDTDDVPGPSYNIWNEIRFPKGQAVEVSDAYMIAKARKNQFFQVAEEETMEAKDHEVETKVEGQGKIEAQAEVIKKQEGDYRKTEKGTGYSPVEKKPKKKTPATPTGADADPRPSDDVA